jgi:hypothetical protein
MIFSLQSITDDGVSPKFDGQSIGQLVTGQPIDQSPITDYPLPITNHHRG